MVGFSISWELIIRALLFALVALLVGYLGWRFLSATFSALFSKPPLVIEFQVVRPAENEEELGKHLAALYESEFNHLRKQADQIHEILSELPTKDAESESSASEEVLDAASADFSNQYRPITDNAALEKFAAKMKRPSTWKPLPAVSVAGLDVGSLINWMVSHFQKTDRQRFLLTRDDSHCRLIVSGASVTSEQQEYLEIPLPSDDPAAIAQTVAHEMFDHLSDPNSALPLRELQLSDFREIVDVAKDLEALSRESIERDQARSKYAALKERLTPIETKLERPSLFSAFVKTLLVKATRVAEKPDAALVLANSASEDLKKYADSRQQGDSPSALAQTEEFIRLLAQNQSDLQIVVNAGKAAAQSLSNVKDISPETPKRLRRRVLSLNTEQTVQLCLHFRELQGPRDEQPSLYEEIASIYPEYGPHGNDLFLPWNRAYLLQFDHSLEESGSQVAVPYWDIQRMAIVPPHFAAVPFPMSVGESGMLPPLTLKNRKDFNPLNYDVFAKVPLKRRSDRFDQAFLRDLQERLLEESDYSRFRESIEIGFNGRVHGWLGNKMGGIRTATHDPLFWAHRANIDRIWHEWQEKHGNDTMPEDVREARLDPFNLTVEEVLNIDSLGYDYVP